MSSDPIEVLREVYWAGWLNASAWANRDDQLDDRGSHAYRKLEDEAVQPALASLSAPKPEGEWVLVPREPTEAMLSHGEGWEYSTISDGPAMARQVYADMLAAAPKPPSVNDNAVAVNESAPVNDKPARAALDQEGGNG